MDQKRNLPVAVIGAGPVGLAAAAQLLKRGFEPLVFERGREAGANVREWAHVRLFTPWRSLIDRKAGALLTARGWQAPDPADLPTGETFLRAYLEPLARLPEIADRLQLNARVTAVARFNRDKLKTKDRAAAPFVLRVADGDGGERNVLAAAVIDASGTWSTPNPLGSDGLPALGERENAARIAYGIPDVLGARRARFAGKRCLIVGAGYSAANVALDLVKLKKQAPETEVIWAVRGDSLAQLVRDHGEGPPSRVALGRAVLAAQEADQIELVTGFRVAELRKHGEGLTVANGAPEGVPAIEGVDQVICATGQRPDLALLRELRTAMDPGLECVAGLSQLIDPAVHSCYSAPPHGWRELRHPDEPGFYVVGMKSYGRTPTFLTITGYQQVSSIVLAMSGDLEAAGRITLDTSIAMADADKVEALLGEGG